MSKLTSFIQNEDIVSLFGMNNYFVSKNVAVDVAVVNRKVSKVPKNCGLEDEKFKLKRLEEACLIK